MSRGYGNAGRYAAQAQAAMTFAGQVRAASVAAEAADAVAGLGTGYVVDGDPATLSEKILDLQAQIDALTP